MAFQDSCRIKKIQGTDYYEILKCAGQNCECCKCEQDLIVKCFNNFIMWIPPSKHDCRCSIGCSDGIVKIGMREGN